MVRMEDSKKAQVIKLFLCMDKTQQQIHEKGHKCNSCFRSAYFSLIKTQIMKAQYHLHKMHRESMKQRACKKKEEEKIKKDYG